MSLIDLLKSQSAWENYHDYKVLKGNITSAEEKDLFDFISDKEYIDAVDRIVSGSILLPERKFIGKSGSSKKRAVFIFPREENFVFKLLTYLLMREYDGIFCDNLYSFRVNNGVRNAVHSILKIPGLNAKYAYKADISDYFNSIDVNLLLPELKEILLDEPEVFSIFEIILLNDKCLENGQIITAKKGVMAGAPFSVFLANIFLSSLDYKMKESGFTYARYSDDIIVFADDYESVLSASTIIKEFISGRGLKINRDKEQFTLPCEEWSFLGFKYHNGKVDVSEVAKKKLKAKIRRRARSIKRWQIRKDASPERAMRAFIKAVNRKLYYSTDVNDLNWSRWYFPIINTDESLREIDAYIQYWARFLITGKHIKSNYNVTYFDLKEAGLITLVNSWYKFRKNGPDS
ncbi:MAG: hypothetical protein IK097_06850 [Clostridia bacterium]|nr:hypothetical protein [Clostridia bacterium]